MTEVSRNAAAFVAACGIALLLGCTTNDGPDAAPVEGEPPAAGSTTPGAAAGSESKPSTVEQGSGTSPGGSVGQGLPTAISGGSGGEPTTGSGGEPLATDGANSPAAPDAPGTASSEADATAPPPSDAGTAGTLGAVSDDAGPPPSSEQRPTLVVSGLDDYFREAELVENPGAVATVVVDHAQTYQVWHGFGGAFTESGWEALSLLDEAERARALALLFDARDGAHLVWGRIPIGADGYALERYTHAEEPDDFALDAFSIERDHEYLIPYVEAALAINSELRLWALPWTPPTWMKQNGAFDGGSIIEDEQVFWAYARYLARFVEEYESLGIDIEAIQPQADPEFEFDYPSCLWRTSALLTFVRDHLVPTLLERDVDVELWLGAFAGSDAASTVALLMNEEAIAASVTGFALQWGAVSAVSAVVESYPWPVMQSEHKPGNFPYLIDDFNPERAPNDHAHAVESWELIKSWVEAGVHSYSAWNLVLDTVGTDLDVVTPWPKSALLAVDRSTSTLLVTPAYHVFRHLSYFIEPGAVRIRVAGAEALAFENPDGSIVAVLFNPETTAANVAVGVRDTVVEFTIPAEGWATLNWQ